MATATVLLGGPSPRAETTPPPPVFVIGAVHMTFVPGDSGPVPATPVRLQQGGRLFFANTDIDAPHTVSSDEAPDGSYQFATENRVQPGDAAEVVGVSSLAPGSYRFICQIHTDLMWGTLTIEPAP